MFRRRKLLQAHHFIAINEFISILTMLIEYTVSSHRSLPITTYYRECCRRLRKWAIKGSRSLWSKLPCCVFCPLYLAFCAEPPDEQARRRPHE
jgi:hypothetical protein